MLGTTCNDCCLIRQVQLLGGVEYHAVRTEISMRFKITLNMPSRKGYSVHQVFAEHPADSIEDFMREFADDGFIVVNELYKDGDDGVLRPHGELGISYMLGCKIALLSDDWVGD